MYTTSAQGTDNPTIDPDNIVVYKQDNDILVSTGSILINSVAVFDIRSRLLYSGDKINAADAKISNLNIASQVLIITVDTIKGRVTKRIVF